MDYFFLGDDELVTAFRFIGISGYTVKDPTEAIAVFRKITEGYIDSNYDLPSSIPASGICQVLILTEETADWLCDYMVNWQLSGKYPLLVEIPGISGKLTGRKTLVEAIREAIGLHV